MFLPLKGDVSFPLVSMCVIKGERPSEYKAKELPLGILLNSNMHLYFSVLVWLTPQINIDPVA